MSEATQLHLISREENQGDWPRSDQSGGCLGRWTGLNKKWQETDHWLSVNKQNSANIVEIENNAKHN